jgi:hypothetical protein
LLRHHRVALPTAAEPDPGINLLAGADRDLLGRSGAVAFGIDGNPIISGRNIAIEGATLFRNTGYRAVEMHVRRRRVYGGGVTCR